MLCIKCHYTEYGNILNVMLSVVTMNVFMLNVSMLSVVMLSVVAPFVGKAMSQP
jgi:hypothetical protein